MPKSTSAVPFALCDAMLIIAGEQDTITADNFFQMSDLAWALQHFEKNAMHGGSRYAPFSIGESVRAWVADRQTGLSNAPAMAFIEEDERD
jgi:hypothetical protein